MAKDWAELSPWVVWKVKILSDETGYLAEDTTKQGIEGGVQYFLNAYHKMQKKRDTLK